MDKILYVLAVMIFWDFSTHLIEMFGWEKKFLHSRSIFSYYYPHLSNKKGPDGPIPRKNRENIYQRFWVTFWGLAFVLIMVYILSK
jgi:hypothetical protein